MVLPAYWWLLALAVAVQGLFLLGIIILRMRGKGVQPLARPALLALGVSCGAGLLYGVVQHDPILVVGQVCLLILYYQIYSERNDR